MAAKTKIKAKCKHPNTCVFPKLYDEDAVKFYSEGNNYGMKVKFKAENDLGMKCNMTAIVIFRMEKGKPTFILVEVN